MPDTIWKFTVAQQDEVGLDLPLGARVLTVQAQGEAEAVCLWALVDPRAPTEKRYFRLFGTGHPIHYPERYAYLGTVQVAGGRLVWHVFEQVLFPVAGSLPS